MRIRNPWRCVTAILAGIGVVLLLPADVSERDSVAVERAAPAIRSPASAIRDIQRPPVLAAYRPSAKLRAGPVASRAGPPAEPSAAVPLPGSWHVNPTAGDGAFAPMAASETVSRPRALASVLGIESDEFNSSTLDTRIWTFVDPIGDSELTMDGSRAVVSVPAGTSHDLWTNQNQVPRLRQGAPNSDFEVEVKFDSPVGSAYQMQGVVVEQDADDLLRFEVHHDGAETRLFAASIAAGAASVQHYSVVTGGAPAFLRVKRVGDTWTLSHSRNGVLWSSASFAHPMVVTAIGPYAGNAGNPPPSFAAQIDYFRNVTSPPDGLPPVLGAVAAEVAPRSAFVTWTTDEPADSRVEYGTTTAYGATVGDPDRTTAHGVGLARLACGTTYHFRVRSSDAAGNESVSGDATFTTTSCPTTIVSDEFDAATLDRGVWAFVDPLADSSLALNGSQAEIAIPPGTRHDLWTGANEAPRLLQAVPDTNFEVEVKFDSPVSEAYQLQGIVVEQDENDLLRFEVHHDGGSVRIFAASIVDGTATAIVNDAAGATFPMYLRVKRFGDKWTLKHSADGVDWRTATSFTRVLSVAAVGPFAGTAGSFPAFTARVDHFREIAPDVTPPIVSDVSATPTAAGTAVVSWTTDEPTDAAVAYGTTTAYEAATIADARMRREHSIVVHGLACGTLHHFEVRSTDDSGNATASADATFTTAACRSAVASDEFDSSALDPGVWAFVDPLGDSTLSLTGSEVALSVPAGTRHDLWTGSLDAPRLLQAVPNADFEVEVKLTNAVTAGYQLQGIVVEQDADDLLRFEVHNDGTFSRLFVGSLAGGEAMTKHFSTVANEVPIYLRVRRAGATWRFKYSHDGIEWTTAATFSRSMAVNALGPFVGNAGSVPAFTGAFDWFRVVPPDVTPPTLSEISVSPMPAGTVEVSWTTDEPTDAAVAYGATAAYEAATISAPGFVRTHAITVHGLACGAVHHLEIRSRDDSDNEARSGDLTVTTPACATSIRSDEFDANALDTSVWAFVDPLRDSTVTLTGAEAHVALPGGTAHDLWTGALTAPRLLQAVSDSNFAVEAAFASPVSAAYQMQGIVVEQDADDLIRFEVHHDGSSVRLFAATIVAGVADTRHLSTLDGDGAVRLRVERIGNRWTFSYSTDGTEWTAVAAFAHTIAVTALGPFAGNSGVAPALTARLVSFRDVTPPPDETPPVVTDVAASPRTYSAVVSWSTDEPATSVVAYGATDAYESGEIADSTLATSHNVTIRGLACETPYHFQVASTDTSGNEARSTDQTFTTTACNDTSGPDIDVWYGDTQTFATIGVPQRWINIVGTVDDPNGVRTLRYSLNGGPELGVGIGPDDQRLHGVGDFNVEIDASWLSADNTVRLIATDEGGNVSTKDVVVNWAGPRAWPLPYEARWSTAGSIADVAQVVDGKWRLDAGGVRTASSGYDRLIAMGQSTWTSYEVLVPITIHSMDTSKPHYGVGLVTGWQGHTGSGTPRVGHPYGGICSYGRLLPGTAPARLELLTNVSESDDRVVAVREQSLALGVTYSMRFRREDLGNGSSRYSCRVWPAGTTEPTIWGVVADLPDWAGETGIHPGSVVLVAHHVDATFGDVTIAPLAG